MALGNFFGGVAKGGLDTYRQLEEEKRLKTEQDYKDAERQRQDAYAASGAADAAALGLPVPASPSAWAAPSALGLPVAGAPAAPGMLRRAADAVGITTPATGLPATAAPGASRYDTRCSPLVR